ncbi:PREDICTED: mas-related G-protein coupled receptor member G [Chrysochloris asiatica]|uniref:Mas-related G-protein coupled receptor member G n=1 Tax=Chrysochloris asiatica TaxID=185453 RepID=A0A9B0T9T0_CHRAS|nr:PREDICTED: mas-related G-protein coupled receptor member G [Chrysochloris asiatica]
MFSIWRTFNNVVFYLTLLVGIGGLVGNGLLLWQLGFHIKKGPFNVYVLNLAAADFLFLGCQLAFTAVQEALGSDKLYLAITFLWFATGLWLLAVLGAERCISDIFPSCHQRCRPRHTSAGLCALVWALTLPAVLLPARACGLLRDGTRFLTCIRYQATSATWLLALVGTACGSGLILFVWVSCCSQRPRPRFYGLVLACTLLLLLCGLPFVLYWILQPLLSFLLSMFLPIATLLACVHCGAKPLVYYVLGRQPGKRESLRAIFQKALGEVDERGPAGLSLPMVHITDSGHQEALRLHKTASGLREPPTDPLLIHSPQALRRLPVGAQDSAPFGTGWLFIPPGAPEDTRGFRAEEPWLFPELKDIERGCSQEHLRQEGVSADHTQSPQPPPLTLDGPAPQALPLHDPEQAFTQTLNKVDLNPSPKPDNGSQAPALSEEDKDCNLIIRSLGNRVVLGLLQRDPRKLGHLHAVNFALSISQASLASQQWSSILVACVCWQPSTWTTGYLCMHRERDPQTALPLDVSRGLNSAGQKPNMPLFQVLRVTMTPMC